ncbi:branched-chain amino acid ABC transporter permease [Bordetella pseudohinzii]|uniref:Branched-chain amino acid ABC transporter permease n=1 Tax=Bordetella pseudohinzii TaxID=1331258 RepID=A0A0J6EYE3_9BORD|nr:branched-chain amino acid ABC transporter permease [Bordetella pseudohinzii]ANY16145.1 branched-chain amino acid ABC transporter permease [Bordetella pseudohinzii]KMM25370.1 branched-chain amino acid ABC transporter permease [Bordetella pseudohinzii]KXA76549.1 branched-chain amino acid ABC transporter permease [Bordetella pseudohinzii]KXA81258.1 branched-chain amino acid ABC transporter permease [Bordetella pseudohinzii]CUJ03937.1 leucine/isoleucine/valine transporter permease subunit [Bord
MSVPVISVLAAAAALGIGYGYAWTITPIVFGLTYAIAALGVSVMARAGQVSFGHAMYACISAYTVAFVARAYPDADALVLIAAGVAASFAAALLVGSFVVRYRGIFFGMLNLALSMVLFALLGKLYTLTGGSDGLRIARPTLAGLAMERESFERALLLLSLLLSLLLAWWVQRYFRSGSGQALSAIKTNETRIEYLGFSAYLIMWKGYLLSAVVVGVSGALLALIQGLVTPEIGSWLRSGEFVFITILGGAGHAAGAFLGAICFETVKLASSAYFPGLWQFVLGLTLILVIFLFPNGFVGQFMKRKGARA